MHTHPNHDDPVDRLAHYLSELHNNNAPMGWERYRYMAKELIRVFGLTDEMVKERIEVFAQ